MCHVGFGITYYHEYYRRKDRRWWWLNRILFWLCMNDIQRSRKIFNEPYLLRNIFSMLIFNKDYTLGG